LQTIRTKLTPCAAFLTNQLNFVDLNIFDQ